MRTMVELRSSVVYRPVSDDERYSYFVCPRCGVAYLYVYKSVLDTAAATALEPTPPKCHRCGNAMKLADGPGVMRVRDAVKSLWCEKKENTTTRFEAINE